VLSAQASILKRSAQTRSSVKIIISIVLEKGLQMQLPSAQLVKTFKVDTTSLKITEIATAETIVNQSISNTRLVTMVREIDLMIHTDMIITGAITIKETITIGTMIEKTSRIAIIEIAIIRVVVMTTTCTTITIEETSKTNSNKCGSNNRIHILLGDRITNSQNTPI